MSRKTEEIQRELARYIEEHADETKSDGEINAMVREFLQLKNRQNEGEWMPANMAEREGPMSVNDYVDLAEESDDPAERLKYARKALKLAPDDLDALRLEADSGDKPPEDTLCAYRVLLGKGKQALEKEGFFKDGVGDFWLLLETRPYMRLLASYMDLLEMLGMYRQAAAEGERILELCNTDNLGARYGLMHLYAALEDEPAAQKVWERYGEYEDSGLLFPLTILYYKLGDMERAREYLLRTEAANRGLRQFLNAMIKKDVSGLLEKANPMGYRPGTEEELLHWISEYMFLYESIPYFFSWAKRNLPARKKGGGKPKK